MNQNYRQTVELVMAASERGNHPEKSVDTDAGFSESSTPPPPLTLTRQNVMFPLNVFFFFW